MKLSATELHDLCATPVRASGADDEATEALGAATLDTELHGHIDIGVAHIFDYLEGLVARRIDGRAKPTIRRTFTFVIADLNGGVPYVGFRGR